MKASFSPSVSLFSVRRVCLFESAVSLVRFFRSFPYLSVFVSAFSFRFSRQPACFFFSLCCLRRFIRTNRGTSSRVTVQWVFFRVKAVCPSSRYPHSVSYFRYSPLSLSLPSESDRGLRRRTLERDTGASWLRAICKHVLLPSSSV